jgi:hypothetical protein
MRSAYTGCRTPGHAGIEHVRDDDHRHDRSHELVVPEVREALTQVGHVSASADSAARSGRSLDEQAHEQGRDGERRGVEEQHVGGIEHRDQHAGKRRTDHARAARDAVEQARAALDGRPGALDELRQDRLARRLTRRVEQGSRRDEGEQGCQRQADAVVEEWDQEHGGAACEIGDDAHPAIAEPVDERAAEACREHERQQREEADEAGLADAARRLQYEPGDRQRRERVPGDGDRVGGEQRRERDPRRAHPGGET